MENLILVNENDEAIGVMEKLQVHQLGLCHRAFSVFIFNEKNEILLQQRHESKYHCGGLWTNTCCGHPRVNESVEVAAERRLYEEMGLKLSLVRRGVFHYRAEFSNGLIEDEIDHVFLGEFDGQEIHPDPKEVSAYQWVALDVLLEALNQEPHQYTPWLKKAVQFVKRRNDENFSK